VTELVSQQDPDDPGDLGRRVTARRRALGLSVDEVARRAGMDPGYLEHIEHHASARPGAAACMRLAGALETSVAWLRGAGVDFPPGHGHSPQATPQLVELDRAECFKLLRPGGVGRAVFVEERGAVALPVNFRVLDDEVVFRTGEGTIAQAVRRGGPLSVEVDHVDEALGEGWSVLVSGEANLLSDPSEISAVDALGVEPWAGGDRHLVVRLRPAEVTGRRIRRWRESAD